MAVKKPEALVAMFGGFVTIAVWSNFIVTGAFMAKFEPVARTDVPLGPEV